MAESLGKKGKGYFPIISNAPRDHHSLLQLYLDGPKDKLFYIFSGDEKLTKKLSLKKYLKKSFFLDNKSINQIKFAQKKALIDTFKKNKISYREFKLKKNNEETLGELFSKSWIVVHPSLSEGFGSIPQEAIQHDCYVISSKTGWLIDHESHEKVKVVKKHSFDKIFLSTSS